MPCSGTGKKVEMIIASEVLDTGSDKYKTDNLNKHPSGGPRKRIQNRAKLQEANLEKLNSPLKTNHLKRRQYH